MTSPDEEMPATDARDATVNAETGDGRRDHRGSRLGVRVSALRAGMFRSLQSYNFRVWSAGALVSNVGAWMQRIAQDWLVLTALTHHDARAVGLVTALQFAPQVLLLPWTGWAADHLDRRRLLFATQSIMGALALGLGFLTMSGLVRAWQVDVFAVLLGCASAFDQPARQTFVVEMVGEEDLSNAMGLELDVLQRLAAGRPGGGGAADRRRGPGMSVHHERSLLPRGAGFAGSPARDDLYRRDRPQRERSGFLDGLRYVRDRPDL